MSMLKEETAAHLAQMKSIISRTLEKYLNDCDNISTLIEDFYRANEKRREKKKTQSIVDVQMTFPEKPFLFLNDAVIIVQAILLSNQLQEKLKQPETSIEEDYK